MGPAEEYSISSGFALKLGCWDFVYTEDKNRLTIPVEMLMQGDYLWELGRSKIKSWDGAVNAPFQDDEIGRILEHITRFVELTGKKIRII